MNNYKEKDKGISAYLLLCKDLRFEGTEPEGDVLYFLFSPNELARQQAELYIAKRTDPIQPKDYAEANQTINDLIWRWRKSRDGSNGGMNYGRYNK